MSNLDGGHFVAVEVLSLSNNQPTWHDHTGHELPPPQSRTEPFALSTSTSTLNFNSIRRRRIDLNKLLKRPRLNTFLPADDIHHHRHTG